MVGWWVGRQGWVRGMVDLVKPWLQCRPVVLLLTQGSTPAKKVRCAGGFRPNPAMPHANRQGPTHLLSMCHWNVVCVPGMSGVPRIATARRGGGRKGEGGRGRGIPRARRQFENECQFSIAGATEAGNVEALPLAQFGKVPVVKASKGQKDEPHPSPPSPPSRRSSPGPRRR